MPTADLNNTPMEFDTTFDSIIIKKVVHDIPGGKTLDVTGVTDLVLKAGNVIIEQTSNKALKPLKIVDGEYESLPGAHTYKGILVATILTKKPFASVMISGDMNEQAAIEYGLPAVPAGAKTDLGNHILFTED